MRGIPSVFDIESSTMSNNIGNTGLNISPQKYNQKALLTETCRLYRLKQEWIALQMGRSQATISKWLDASKPDFPDFDDWNNLLELIKTHTGSIEPLRGVANWHGADAVLLSNSDTAIDAQTLGRITSILARKSGSVVGLLVQILEDGVVTDLEEDQISEALPEIEALYVALADLRERAKAKGRKAVCA